MVRIQLLYLGTGMQGVTAQLGAQRQGPASLPGRGAWRGVSPGYSCSPGVKIIPWESHRDTITLLGHRCLRWGTASVQLFRGNSQCTAAFLGYSRGTASSPPSWRARARQRMPRPPKPRPLQGPRPFPVLTQRAVLPQAVALRAFPALYPPLPAVGGGRAGVAPEALPPRRCPRVLRSCTHPQRRWLSRRRRQRWSRPWTRPVGWGCSRDPPCW